VTDSFENRAVREFASGGQFALWCTRSWAACVKQGQPATPRMLNGLEIAGIPEALADLEAFFTLLAGHARRDIVVGCCKCSRTTPDEARLLRVLHAGQTDSPAQAAALLRVWLPGETAAAAAWHAVRLGQRMLAVELPIGLWHGRAPERVNSTDAGLHLLH